MPKLILSTGNIVSGGPSIIRRPGAYRSNLELTQSLQNSFLAAQQDYAAVAQNGNGNGIGIGIGIGNGIGNGTGTGHADHHKHKLSDRPAMSIWTAAEDGALYVPRIDWSAAGLQEEATQYDITVKLFFLPTAPVSERAQYAREALGLIRNELGVAAVDLLILSFPDMSFEGDCEWEADKHKDSQGNDEEETATWSAVGALLREGLVRKMGVAEFGSEKLARFIQRTQIRPAVDQINVKDCCNVPLPLAELAKEQGIELLAHSDCTDVLPKETLRELLGQGPQGAGILADRQSDAARLKGDLAPRWVVKYTAVVRDRGVIENKGYFAVADLLEDC